MTAIVDWLARREWCLPAAAALAWWALFYPGFRRDAAMTSGLLLCAIALTRTWAPGARFSRIDFATLALAVPLVSTRQNSTPTLIATAVLLLAVRKWRHAAAIGAVAVGAITLTYVATRAAGHTSPVDSIQAVDAVMADISCLLSDPNVAATDAEWAALSPIAGRND